MHVAAVYDISSCWSDPVSGISAYDRYRNNHYHRHHHHFHNRCRCWVVLLSRTATGSTHSSASSIGIHDDEAAAIVCN